jgi:uncharacterized protein YxeA
MMIILAIVILLVLIDLAALRWGQDSTDGREGYVWEQEHHGQDNFSVVHHAFTAL